MTLRLKYSVLIIGGEIKLEKMKTKRILLSLMLIVGAFSVNAQEWRGFLELTAGISPSKSDITVREATFRNVWNPLSFGLNYTMGIRVHPQIFAGVGIGGYTAMMNYDEYGYAERQFPSLYFPVFANARWIPDITKKINPFVDLKIGYQMGVDLDGSNLYYDYDSSDYYAYHKNGLFLQPQVGVRFGRDSAFNLGLAYNVSMRRDFVAKDRTKPNRPVLESLGKSYGFFMLTFGADF